MGSRFTDTTFHRIAAPTCALVAALLVGCSVSEPVPETVTLEGRLGTFESLPAPPLKAPATIYWNDYQVPFIVAETDGDGALLLGMVHAHLRLGQMEALKRVAYGRAAEMVGPPAREIDIALRTIGIGAAAERIEANLSPQARTWMERYVQGINFYKAHMPEQPHEFTVLKIDADEPWTVRDSITLGRLTGIDINWAKYLALMPYRETERWEALWDDFRQVGISGKASFKPTTGTVAAAQGVRNARALMRLFDSYARWGSNSIAIGPQRTASGASMIASDPHLGYAIPNIWLIAGMKTPSYHMVGMTAPGLPVFGFGRNPDLAWGGTHLRPWTSDLVDVSSLDPETFEETEIDVSVRWWLDTSIDVRISPYGPIVSDLKRLNSPEGRTLALKWIGHDDSDEFTALLQASRARDGKELREAFSGFALPGQNFIFADRDGNIGHILSTQVPRRTHPQPQDLWIDTETADQWWSDVADASELPWALNPPDHVISSANNLPTRECRPPVGWFYPPSQRAERGRAFIHDADVITVEKLKDLQRDTYSKIGYEVSRLFLDRAIGAFTVEANAEALQGWDGRYEIDATGAVVYEAVLARLAPELFDELGLKAEFELWEETGYIEFMLRDLAEEIGDERFDALLAKAIRKAEGDFKAGTTWGDIHRLSLQSALAEIPIVGSKYVFEEIPLPGSRHTFFKSDHPLTAKPHNSFYGSQSRHISDLSDLDANYFVLLGGQDGRINSENFLDQVPLYQRGEYIRMPLRLDTVKAEFPRATRYQPR